MATKFVGENLSCVKWAPIYNSVLDKASLCVTVSQESGKKSISLWNCSTEKISLESKVPIQNNGTGLSFLSHKTFVVGTDGDPDRSLQVWDISSKSELSKAGTLKTSNKRTTHVSTSEKFVASVGEQGYLQVYLPSQEREVYSAKCEMCLNTSHFYLSHSVLVGTAAGQVHNFDTRQGDIPAATLSSDLVSILGIAVHTTQPFIIANSRSDGSLLIWDNRNARFPLATFAGHASAIWEVQFEKEKSDNLYTCSEDGQLLMWNGAVLSGVGGLLGGGGKVSPWLTPEISHQKMDVFNLLGSDNKLSINSFDVLEGRVVCGGVRQTLFCIDSCDE